VTIFEGHDLLTGLESRLCGFVECFSPERLSRPSEYIKGLKNSHHNLQSLGLFFHGSESLTDVKLEIFSQVLEKLASLQRIYLTFSHCKDISNIGLLSLSRCLEKLLLVKGIHLKFNGCQAVTEKGIRKVQERLCLLPFFGSESFKITF